MKKIAIAAFACAAALSLAACGKSDDAAETATPDNVEMPADELPAAEASMPAPAAVDAPAADASVMSKEDAAMSAADNAKAAADAAKAAAAEAATDAEHKM